jgi:hypothetical protein
MHLDINKLMIAHSNITDQVLIIKVQNPPVNLKDCHVLYPFLTTVDFEGFFDR